MDTGLNNKNKLHLALQDNYLEDVEWIIEATSAERHEIWKQYHEQHVWEEVSMGTHYTILELEVDVRWNHMINTWRNIKKERLPVCIDFSYAIVDGHKILFYDCPSMLVHHGYVKSFMSTYFQRTHDKYSRWNHTNAVNAHNCFNYLDTIDKKPRETIYKPSDDEKRYYIFKEL